ncbi:hypothetical protein SARC_01474 [Sphaeroforma arctica JP610]|uniref:Uncharacterized protein n=1 Tax=Sphaeroforma arctica JP610 TaxID=667725 RepID=A0A0L0GBU4_9EUKA|nr:hypothetical protein SARC_01474 [Sphaeroforma arctica JP610]KNC86379.1 hypothetical protein SARC_01474 [Sphaeroforma arctica JP610]|eukprot:XP_014160281.1 hypothetical protein SARC_01474 [Sphaeroforma arctica JP610]
MTPIPCVACRLQVDLAINTTDTGNIVQSSTDDEMTMMFEDLVVQLEWFDGGPIFLNDHRGIGVERFGKVFYNEVLEAKRLTMKKVYVKVKEMHIFL